MHGASAKVSSVKPGTVWANSTDCKADIKDAWNSLQLTKKKTDINCISANNIHCYFIRAFVSVNIRCLYRLKGKVSSKMTYILIGHYELAYFRKLVIYVIKNYHSKVKFEATNDLFKVGVFWPMRPEVTANFFPGAICTYRHPPNIDIWQISVGDDNK